MRRRRSRQMQRRRSKEYFQGLHFLALIDSEFESDFHQILGYYKVKKSATLSKNFHQSKSMMTNHDDGLASCLSWKVRIMNYKTFKFPPPDHQPKPKLLLL